MKKIACLNLSEQMNGMYEKDKTFGTVLDRMKKKSGYDRFERIYVGSSFCSQYFLHAKKEMIQNLCLFAEHEGMKITLSIPQFSQKDLALGKEKIKELYEAQDGSIDEITVNDYGMLEWIADSFPCSIAIGRLFMKDYREKRYFDYFDRTLCPKAMNDYFFNIIKPYPVSAFEFDLTHRRIDLRKLPESYAAAVHYPYCYQTVGMICEAASAFRPVEKKYRPNLACGQECHSQQIVYHTDNFGEYIKKGRTVYFENGSCEVISNRDIRWIYFPLDKEAYHENTGTIK